MGIIIVLDSLLSVQGLVELVDLMDNNHSMELEQLNICQKFIHTITFSGNSFVKISLLFNIVHFHYSK